MSTHNMFLWRTIENHTFIITKCHLISSTGLQESFMGGDADRKIHPRVTIWHHEASPSDAKQ